MDRRWVYGKQFTPTYVKGVEEFMNFVSERYPKDTHIRCPCVNCLNQRLRPQSEVETHIHIYGMSATYTRWIHHGESADTEVEGIEEEVEGYDHDFGIHMDVDDDVYDDDHGVPEMIGELFAVVEADGKSQDL
jgi:hypothetical protein